MLGKRQADHQMIWLQDLYLSLINQVTVGKPHSPSAPQVLHLENVLPTSDNLRKNQKKECFQEDVLADYYILLKWREFGALSIRRLGASLAGRVFQLQSNPWIGGGYRQKTMKRIKLPNLMNTGTHSIIRCRTARWRELGRTKVQTWTYLTQWSRTSNSVPSLAGMWSGDHPPLPSEH